MCPFATAAIILAVSGSASALCLADRAQPENEAVFLMAYAKSLAMVKGGSDRIFGRGEHVAVELMAQLKNAARDFECAATILQPYKNSGNAGIQISARGGFLAANQLQDWTKSRYRFVQRLLDGKLSAGRAADQAATATSELDRIWENYQLSAVGVMHAITAIDPATGKTGLFVITAKEREAFLAALSHTFGQEIEQGSKGRVPGDVENENGAFFRLGNHQPVAGQGDDRRNTPWASLPRS